MSFPINIAVAEDHDLVREGVVALLRGNENIQVICEAANGAELMKQLKTSKPDIVLLDLEMPVMSGREVLEKIKRKYPKIKVIIVSAHFSDAFVIEYVKRGADSFLPKNCNSDKLIDAIFAVHEVGGYFDPKMSKLLADELSNPKETKKALEIEFSETEIKVIKLIVQNKTNKEIGNELNLSKRTVDWHRANIMQKIGANHVSALILHAIKHKIVNVL